MSQSSRIKIQDIASHAGVSISTVSRVINGNVTVSDEKRIAVESAIQTLEYRPNPFARGLSSGQSMTVGVLTQNFGTPFYDTILRGILQGLEGSRYSSIFADGRWQAEVEKNALQLLHDRQVDGLIIIGGQLDHSMLTQFNLPLVLVAHHIESLHDHCVYVDNVEGAYQATRHLIEMGHEKIAHITAPRVTDTWDGDIQERYQGYKKALQEAGIPIDPQLIIEGDLLHQSGLQAVEMLLMRGKIFSAIFAANDQMALGAKLGLFRRGWRVPQDVSVVGFDDLDTAPYTIPPLTTVSQPALEMGKAAASSILAQLKGEDPQHQCFDAELIIRESVQRKR